MHISLKQTLLVGSSVAAFALTAGPAFAQSASQEAETVIVTGTRVQGMTAADSAAPITVLGTDALTHGTGSSRFAPAIGPDRSVLHRPAIRRRHRQSDACRRRCAAFPPMIRLVLVNGKRRHYTGNLHVDAGGFAAGSSGADLSLIPSAAIDHVEVLLDGAAAQYGTDAVVRRGQHHPQEQILGRLLSANSRRLL